jgi:tRNA(Met) C34 N-acetyltransferase TmcA
MSGDAMGGAGKGTGSSAWIGVTIFALESEEIVTSPVPASTLTVMEAVPQTSVILALVDWSGVP